MKYDGELTGLTFKLHLVRYRAALTTSMTAGSYCVYAASFCAAVIGDVLWLSGGHMGLL